MARNTRTFSDLDMNFVASDTTGDIYKRFDDTAIKTAVKNLIFTTNGERPFHPEIGSPVRNLLFENYTPMLLLSIRRAIEYTLRTYEPRVEVLDVVVDPFVDENRIEIGIYYRIKNTDATMAVTFTLDRTR